MNTLTNWKYYLAWLPGVPIAILNGSVRQYLFIDYLNMSELTAHQLSVVNFILLFGLYIWLVLPWLKPESAKQAWQVGLLWLGLTVAFEFLFGHYLMGHSWERLLHDYNILAGRLWLLVLAWTAAGPAVLWQWRSETAEG